MLIKKLFRMSLLFSLSMAWILGCKTEVWKPEYHPELLPKASESSQTQILPSRPEDMDYLDNGIVRIGVNKGAGGVITSLMDIKQGENLVNNFDLGRQIQMSFYSGPIPYSQNGKQPHPTWIKAGWNPVQAGDTYGNWSKTLEFKNDGKDMYIKSIPMQWALNGELCDCTFESWIALENNTVKIRQKITNNRADKTFYGAYFQELPAIFTNSNFYKLYSYSGTKPFLNEAPQYIAMQDNSWQFPATENWAALLNDNNWGLGIWKPDSYRFAGGSFGKAKSGGERAYATGYIAPVENEILDYNASYEFSYTLIVGSLTDIRSYVYQQTDAKKRLPNYVFDKDRQHFYYTDKTQDGGYPINGEVQIKLDQNLTELYAPWGSWQAANVPKLYIKAAYNTDATTGRLYWMKNPTESEFLVSRSITFPIIADGQYHTYEIDVSKHIEWNGTISRLMFAPIDRNAGKTGHWIKVKSISYK
jgi:hypothetical protein